MFDVSCLWTYCFINSPSSSNLIHNVIVFQEYENQTSLEAKFVKDLDKLEMCYQAFEYEKEEESVGRLQEFFDYTKSETFALFSYYSYP